MRFEGFAGICLAAIASISVAEKIPDNHILWGPQGPPKTIVKRATSTTAIATATSSRVADSACTNGPLTRTCWSSGFSAATDFDAKWPTTGKTVSYNLEITNGTCNPDGHGAKPCQLLNNQYPGPLITANWGDTISVTVKNSLSGNGTGIHWHGIRQLNTAHYDGVPGITECPLAPGDSKTYTFQATQHGTTWYHSHYSNQYGDGAFGPLVINGPGSANYDLDLGPMMVNDYYYSTAWQIGIQAHNNLQKGQAPPNADTIMVNGLNKNSGGGGSYGSTLIKKGKKYRLRLINTSADNNIWVSLDNHPFQVITSDLVPIKPFVTNWVLLAIGQRYDVIINANQTEGNYWFRANVATACASANNFYGRSIFTYDSTSVTPGAPSTDPAADPPIAMPGGCADMSPLVPWVANTVGSSSDFIAQAGNLDVDVGVEQLTTNQQNIVFWGVNLTAINVNWDKPTLQYVADKNTSYPTTYNLIELPNEGIWSYWIIQETAGTQVPIPHPIHLHGHDFYVLGQGTGQFDMKNTPNTLTYTNPPRRDTAILPGQGWLAIAFPTDNPGAWLMHCHIAWHVADGLAVQFLEAKSQTPAMPAGWETTCANYQKYDQSPVYPKVDSGL
ncbi:multicopper oxidase [Pleomassaria siparia CBS 279.74]|uniref:laccase n=1 Tax=Pleomassaria siparia CBS 279.74 TaxID=1314801 RepID=A0A6G1K3P7_9PLEO|nr:multicopper oxidase [Pleomassaria siparia CBS 279.74]